MNIKIEVLNRIEDLLKYDGLYTKWNNAKIPRTRKKYAGLILEKIKGWKI